MDGWSPKKGAIIVDGQQVAETLQCIHCGMHWVVVHGSGKVRGYCLICREVTCGAEACNVHAPIEERLAYTEAIAGSDFKTVQKLLASYPGIQSI
jgi:hypothetical protein